MRQIIAIQNRGIKKNLNLIPKVLDQNSGLSDLPNFSLFIRPFGLYNGKLRTEISGPDAVPRLTFDLQSSGPLGVTV